MTTPCRACGKNRRKTTIAFILEPGKGLVGACVCAACAAGGVLLVAPKVESTTRENVYKPDVVARAIRRLRVGEKLADAVKHNSESKKDAVYHYASGRVEAYRMAIKVIEQEACDG